MDYKYISSSVAQNGYIVAHATKDHLLPVSMSSHLWVMALCTAGHATFQVNQEPQEVQTGDRLCFPHVITMLPLEVSDDFEAAVIIVNDELILSCSMGIAVEFMQNVFTTPVRHVENKVSWRLLNNLLACLEDSLTMPKSRHTFELGATLVRNIIIVMGEVERQHGVNSRNTSFTTADTYFRDFFALLDKHIRTEHEVAFYASQLHITPKYLNEIVKRKSGIKAKDAISIILANRIKREIMLSGKSMKEIAVLFNFAGQSSLGKFFRKHTGMSPAAFRDRDDWMKAD